MAGSALRRLIDLSQYLLCLDLRPSAVKGMLFRRKVFRWEILDAFTLDRNDFQDVEQRLTGVDPSRLEIRIGLREPDISLQTVSMPPYLSDEGLERELLRKALGRDYLARQQEGVSLSCQVKSTGELETKHVVGLVPSQVLAEISKGLGDLYQRVSLIAPIAAIYPFLLFSRGDIDWRRPQYILDASDKATPFLVRCEGGIAVAGQNLPGNFSGLPESEVIEAVTAQSLVPEGVPDQVHVLGAEQGRALLHRIARRADVISATSVEDDHSFSGCLALHLSRRHPELVALNHVPQRQKEAMVDWSDGQALKKAGLLAGVSAVALATLLLISGAVWSLQAGTIMGVLSREQATTAVARKGAANVQAMLSEVQSMMKIRNYRSTVAWHLYQLEKAVPPYVQYTKLDLTNSGGGRTCRVRIHAQTGDESQLSRFVEDLSDLDFVTGARLVEAAVEGRGRKVTRFLIEAGLQ